MIKFTDNFIELCDNCNQLDLAKNIKINQSQISRYFKGVIPNIKTVVAICNYFNCSVDYIVGINDKFFYKSSHKNFNNTKFYPRYKEMLDKNNLTHYQFAKLGIVCETSLRLWKKGMLPKFEVLFNIAKTLNTSIDYLIGKSDYS